MNILVGIYIGSVPTTTTVFGRSTESIVLNDVQCSGSEAKLTDCPVGGAICSSNQHAGVYCQAGGGI